jgi:hypothetical protein
MATSTYLAGRKKYGRPQAMLWSENAGTLQNGIYVPNGFEVGYDDDSITDLTLLNQFLILSDHNRDELKFDFQRIEQRQRMINGRMRSFHVADKLQLNVSWDMLPSRGFAYKAKFNEFGKATSPVDTNDRYTVDGGAGGVELLSWYESHPGPFWVYLAYDKNTNFKDQIDPDSQYERLAEYNQIIQMYISDFSYSVVQRGNSTHDFWNISVSLEEV